MALYYHLPVFKASYDLLLDIFHLTANFSREYKYTIGQDLKKETTEMILGIYRANSVVDKKELIKKARENLETIRLLIRISHDLKQTNLQKFVNQNELIESISKQLAVWQYITEVKETSTGDIAKNTNIARPTVKQTLEVLLKLKKIVRVGLGRSTRYKIL